MGPKHLNTTTLIDKISPKALTLKRVPSKFVSEEFKSLLRQLKGGVRLTGWRRKWLEALQQYFEFQINGV